MISLFNHLVDFVTWLFFSSLEATITVLLEFGNASVIQKIEKTVSML